MNEETVLEALRAIAFSDFTDYIRVEDGEVRVKDTSQLTDAQRSAIAGIKDTGKGVEIKLHDKQKALELLVKYLDLFDRPEENAGLQVIFDGVPEEWSE